MIRKNKILVLLCCLFPWMWAAAQTVNTTVGSGSICPNEEIVIPITVGNCNNVAAISLALNFENTKVIYNGYQNVNSAVSTMLINQSNGTIYMTWANMSAVNVGNGTLVELRFTSTGVSGNANLSWNTSQCEYSGVSGTPLPANYTNGTVNVYAVPSISSHPTSFTLTEGNSSYFQVSVSGQGPSYQWQILPPGESTWLDLGNDSHHSGVNNYRLYVNNVTMAMNGNRYRCVVSGTCGSPVTSRIATLTVNQYIPTIATSLGTVTTCFDQVFSIPVNVTNCNNVGAISLVLEYNANLVTYVGYENANPEMSNGYMRVNASNGRVYFTWATSSQSLQMGNGQLISFAFRSAAGNSQLTWNTAQCEYSNPSGQSIPASYSNSNLTIYYPPTITSQPSNRSVMEGSNTSFSVNATGNNLAYQWKMSQDNGISWETLSNGGHYSGVNSSTLYINDVLYTMDGYRYRCEVSGTCEPSVVSNYASLAVEMQMSNIQTTAGSLNTCTQTSFGIPISVTDCNRVGAISLALAYDNTKLTYTGYEGVNPALANGMLQVNAVNGTVFISWASVEGANVGNSNLLTLNFTAQATGSSNLTWNTNYCEYANPRGAVFPSTYVNGSVTVGDMSFQITSQPVDQTVTMGESTNFNVEVSGTTSGFQWQVSTDGGSSWSNVIVGNGEHYSNPNSHQLSVSNTTIEMNGYRYRCVISGSCGVQYSSSALLTVNLPPNYYEITLAVDPEEGGTVTGAGAHIENTPCTVVATPAVGYNFVNWTENGVEVSNEASYTFIPTANRNLVAHFTLQEITISVSANPMGAGTLNGGGTYLYGSHVLLTAIPITGSVFDNWTENGEVVSTNQSISFTAEADRTLVANFSVQQINIAATPVPAGNGSVEGSGVYAYGSTVTLVAHAGEGFEFSNWTENGLVISSNDTLSFTAEDDRNLEAHFVTQSLTITTAVDPEIGGTVTGAGTYEYGDPVLLTATPIGTAEFIEWRENGQQVSDQPTYSFNAYTDRHLVAHFNVTVNITATTQPEGSGVITGSGTYTYGHTATLSTSPNTGYSFVNWIESDTVYSTTTTISLTAYENRSFVAHYDSIMHHVSVASNSEVAGWVSGGGDFIEGSQVMVSAHPNNQFDFVRWTENNQTVSVNPNYSFQIWGDHNLMAEFERHITDTTAYTCHDFEWHGHTYTSDGIYYDTLTSYLGIDSIVRLHLQFLPNYYIPEERFVCDSLSVMWHGKTLTDSGVYYDSLFSADGCDSIHAMTIQFFRTPVGDFSYITPTDDAEITIMPLTLAWNTVTGATSYDLYLWDVNDPEPDVPYRPNMSSSYTTVSALMNYHTYNWYVVARNACHEQTSETKSFHLNVTPDLTLSANTINFGEVPNLNNSANRSLSVNGYYLGAEVEVQIVGEDAEAFSYTIASGWNSYTGGYLVLTFQPLQPRFEYQADLIVKSGALADTVSLIGGVASLYTFNTIVDEEVFSMGSIIPIHGSAVNWANEPAANIEVEVGVTVMNMKRTLTTQTDADGLFSVDFEPMTTESGYYTVNSGRVGYSGSTVHDEFNIPGIALVNTDMILCQVTQDQPKSFSVLIRNKSNVPVNNIQLTTITAPTGCTVTSTPLSLGGLDEQPLEFTVTGSTLSAGAYYEEVKLKAISGEGAETNFSIWFYCIAPRSALHVSPNSVNTTMTKGSSKIIDVMLTNYGTGETGTITVSLPNVPWMSIVGADTVSSLSVNDTAYFSIRLSPDDNVALTPYSGNIAINSERGDGVSLPYYITAVSTSKGNLVVDVTDDFTFNGDGSHLEGAYVKVIGYYSLETVAQGYTDSNGIFRADTLLEGFYRVKVTAPRHSEFNSIVEIEAGTTDNVNAYLQYQAITYSWDVQPTEIQDEYTFELDVVFETNVPTPVITLEHAGTHPIDVGESADFILIVTNHGMISAYETQITFSESDEYIFTLLYDYIDTIPAQTTIIIPGTYQRVESTGKYSSFGVCGVVARSVSVYYCGLDRQWHNALSGTLNVGFNTCNMPDIFQALAGLAGNSAFGIPLIGGGGGGGNGNVTAQGSGAGAPAESSDEACDPCIEQIIKAVLGCLPSDGIIDCLQTANAAEAASMANDILHDNFDWGRVSNNMKDDILGCLLSSLGPAGSIASCVIGAMKALGSCVNVSFSDGPGGINAADKGSRGAMDNVQFTIDGLYNGSQYLYDFYTFSKSFYAEDAWEDEENVDEFLAQFMAAQNDTTGYVSDEVAENIASNFVGTSLTHDDIISFFNRWNRSLDYWNEGYATIADLPEGYDTCFIQLDTTLLYRVININDYYVSEGYDNVMAAYEEASYNAQLIADKDAGSSVCASVKVRFSQSMTMTREAFEGTFTVHNGHDSKPIQAIDLDFVIKNRETGEDCTSLFQINLTSLNNITGIDGDGSLGADLDGMALIQFIPTKNAAPTIPIIYSFGGTFTFLDPYSDEMITFDLYPVDLTVNPSPDLYVDYFMQRDILGDDALTEDKVEPSVPAELGVRIHNKGMGIAKNVNLETAEPEIIDNEKGLAVDFAMYGASYNGNPTQLGLMNIPFGNIASGASVVGEWLFTSSLLGHFVSYEAHVIHNNSFDNPELSLVSALNIHELIHPIRVYGAFDDGINDFLVNDVLDLDDMPDSLYFSQGGRTGVGIMDTLTFDHMVVDENNNVDTIVTLSVNPSRIGWNYGVCDDPGGDKYEIVSCTRDFDNQEIPLQNVWQTFVTLLDEADPIYENKLHIIDTLSNNVEDVTYTLVYTMKPDLLKVEEIIGIPTEGFIEYPLTSFQVKFSEPIYDSTFTYEDMTLKCQNGPNRMDSTVVITRVTDSLYNVNIAGLTNDTGYYVLNVNPIGIKDRRGYGGYAGKQATWIQILTGITQAMTLNEGWNWWSTYIEQNGIDGLTMLENSLGSNGILIKASDGHYVEYVPDWETWWGDDIDIRNESMYEINLSSLSPISMSGILANPSNHPITITQGWNWIGYPVNTALSTETALSSLSPAEDDILQARNGYSVYWPNYGFWGDVENLLPGNGYKYQSHNPDSQTLTYPSNREVALDNPIHPATVYPEAMQHQYLMDVTAIADLDGKLVDAEHYELQAVSNGQLRGRKQLRHCELNGLHVALLVVYGDASETVGFRLRDMETGRVYEGLETVGFKSEKVVGALSEPFTIHFSTEQPNGQLLVNMFPNPIKTGETVYLDMMDAVTGNGADIIEVFNAVGDRISISTTTAVPLSFKVPNTAGLYVVRVVRNGVAYHGTLIVTQ